MGNLLIFKVCDEIFGCVIQKLFPYDKFHHVIRNYEHLIMIHEEWMPAYREMLKTASYINQNL